MNIKLIKLIFFTLLLHCLPLHLFGAGSMIPAGKIFVVGSAFYASYFFKQAALANDSAQVRKPISLGTDSEQDESLIATKEQINANAEREFREEKTTSEVASSLSSIFSTLLFISAIGSVAIPENSQIPNSLLALKYISLSVSSTGTVFLYFLKKYHINDNAKILEQRDLSQSERVEGFICTVGMFSGILMSLYNLAKTASHINTPLLVCGPSLFKHLQRNRA